MQRSHVSVALIEFPIARGGRQAVELLHVAEIGFIRMSGIGDKPPLYNPYAWVVHLDVLNASFFGHYICYVKDLKGAWYKIDDSKRQGSTL